MTIDFLSKKLKGDGLSKMLPLASSDRQWITFPREQGVYLPSVVKTWQTTTLNHRRRRLGDEEEYEPRFAGIGCSFATDDSTILITSTIAQINDKHEQLESLTWNPQSSTINIWEVVEDEDEVEKCGEMFTYSCSPQPRFSSCGNLVGAVLQGFHAGITLIGFDIKEDVKHFRQAFLQSSGSSFSRRTLCCAFSPRGDKVAAINDLNMAGQNMDTCELSIWRRLSVVMQHTTGLKSEKKDQSNYALKSTWTTRLSAICPQISGKLRDCKFSPSAEQVCILSSTGILFLVDIKLRHCTAKLDPNSFFQSMPNQEDVWFNIHHQMNNNIWEDNQQEHPHMNPLQQQQHQQVIYPQLFQFIRAFDFDPRFLNSVLMVASGSTLRLMRENKCSELVCTISLQLPNPHALVNSVNYSRDGSFLAVCTCQGVVYVYETRSWTIKHTLKEEGGSCCLSSGFSWTGEELVSSYSNGVVNVWQLPRKTTLKELCRKALREINSPLGILCLKDLPRGLKDYLNFEPVW